jgi:hypothetical protein
MRIGGRRPEAFDDASARSVCIAGVLAMHGVLSAVHGCVALHLLLCHATCNMQHAAATAAANGCRCQLSLPLAAAANHQTMTLSSSALALKLSALGLPAGGQSSCRLSSCMRQSR